MTRRIVGASTRGYLPLAECRLRLVRLLLDLGPSRVADLAPLYDTSAQRVAYLLQDMRKLGIVDTTTHSGRNLRWFAVPDAEARIKAFIAEAERVRDEMRANRREREKAAAQAKLDAQLERWAQRSVQRIVSAASAPPLRVRAPNSVFALGQYA